MLVLRTLVLVGAETRGALHADGGGRGQWQSRSLAAGLQPEEKPVLVLCPYPRCRELRRRAGEHVSANSLCRAVPGCE